MIMAQIKQRKKNFDLFSGFGYFTPDIRDLIMLVVWFLVGILLGNVISAILAFCLGESLEMEYILLICYPVMFIPAMMYASFKSHRNALFEPEFPLDSKNFGKMGGALCALLVAIATLCANLLSGFFEGLMPEMPDWLERMMESATKGDFWVNFISVSIFAPIFEEWLCRGEILRGLLNFKKDNGERGIKPVWAILISAAFFAIIHANPWQAIPAMFLGVIFGYVYYKTGSLKLTMLMHCVNNTFALVCSRIPAWKDIDSFSDVMDAKLYAVLLIACAMMLALIIKKFSTIDKQDSQENGI